MYAAHAAAQLIVGHANGTASLCTSSAPGKWISVALPAPLEDATNLSVVAAVDCGGSWIWGLRDPSGAEDELPEKLTLATGAGTSPDVAAASLASVTELEASPGLQRLPWVQVRRHAPNRSSAFHCGSCGGAG